MSVSPARSALLTALSTGAAAVALLLPGSNADARSLTAAHGSSHTNIYVMSPRGDKIAFAGDLSVRRAGHAGGAVSLVARTAPPVGE
jgi:uncharacterized RmlC-like cupin family protein